MMTETTLPKMYDICEQTKKTLDDITPVLNIKTDDNLMSSIQIRGSFDPREKWNFGIFQNSRYFIFAIVPTKGKRYYDSADPKVTVDLWSSHYDLKKFRKYTGPVEKVILKIREWMQSQKESEK